MTYTFQGTPQSVMFEHLQYAKSALEAPNAEDARYRVQDALLDLVGLYDRLAQAPVDDETLRRFRRESAEALAALEWRLNGYVHHATYLAEEARDDEWYELCCRRSAIQSLFEDYAGTPVLRFVNRGDVVDLDVEMSRVGLEQGPLHEKLVGRGLPASHWWWSYPREGDEDAAGFQRPLDWLSESVGVLHEATESAKAGSMTLDVFAGWLSETEPRLRGVLGCFALRSNETGIEAFVNAMLGQVERQRVCATSSGGDAKAVRRVEEEFLEHEPVGHARIGMGLFGTRQVRRAADALRSGLGDASWKVKLAESVIVLRLAIDRQGADYYGPLGERFDAYVDRHLQLAAQLGAS